MRGEVVQIRLTAEEKARLAELATQKKLTISELVRAELLGPLPQVEWRGLENAVGSVGGPAEFVPASEPSGRWMCPGRCGWRGKDRMPCPSCGRNAIPAR